MKEYIELGDTVYFWFAANDTAGSGGDGASAVYDIRLGGAAAGAAPVLSGNATLLSHANYSAGLYEIEVQATAGNGFATNSSYAVFCTLAIDAQNPSGFAGGFSIGKALTGADFGMLLETTIATLSTQSSFTLTEGSTADDAYNLRLITVQDASDARFIDIVKISDYTGSTKTVTLTTPTSTFSAAAGDTVRVYKDYHPELVTVTSDLRKIRGTNLTGTGTSGDPWGPE